MSTKALGITFKETMAGDFALGDLSPEQGENAGEDQDSQLAMHAEVTIDDLDKFIDDPKHLGKLSGSIDFTPFGEDIKASNGVFNLFKPTDDPNATHMVYELAFNHNNQDYYLAGFKEVKDDRGFDLWSDTTTLFTTLYKGKDKQGEIAGAGILRLGMVQLAKLLSTVEVSGTDSEIEKSKVVAKFGGFFMGSLWDSYAIPKFRSEKQSQEKSRSNQLDYDVIIIGSGFGGAVTACRLAEKGMSVCLLERGRRWQPKDYPRSPDDAWWWSGDEPQKHNGWIDLQFYDDMAVAQGCGVGGGSLIYANIFVEAEPFSFEADWPKEITYEALKPYYIKTGQMMNVQELPSNQWTERTKMMKTAADACGYGDRFRMLPLAVTFNKDWTYEQDDPFNEDKSVSHTNAQGVTQGTCIHCGNCDIGCSVQAKNTLDLNYIPVAEKNGAVVKPLHLVNKITPINNTGYRVDFDRIDNATEKLIPGSLNAKKVIVAAGTMGSNELLLRCRNEFGSLPNISDQLGLGWSSNGDFLTPATYSGKDISPTQGPTITCAIDFLDGEIDGNRFFVEDGGFPDVLGNAMEEGVSNSKLGLMFNGLSLALRNRDPLSCIMPWFGQAVDASDGRLHLSRSWMPPFRKKLDLDWEIDKSEAVVQAMIDMHKKFSDETGGTPLVPPSWKFTKDLVTPHPLGGCRMADNAEKGVVDHKGEVFGHPGLYVADGSIIPKAIGLNPSRTIAALAERIAEHIEV